MKINVVWGIVAAVVVPTVVNCFIYILAKDWLPGRDVGSFTVMFVIALFVSPVLETFIFQFIVFRVVGKFIDSTLVRAAFSWALFSLAHFGSVGSFVMAGLVSGGGMVLLYSFYYKDGELKAALATICAHSTINIVAVLLYVAA